MNYLNLKTIFTGTQVAYYIICPTKLWLFSHFTTMEQESELVSLGKIIQEIFYQHSEKDLIIDQKISIDFIKKGNKLIIHETKKSSSLEKAHIFQVLYYIYYLKYEKGIKNVEGIINYPTKKKIVKVKLTKEKEEELIKILNQIKKITSLPTPPKPQYKKYCKKCSYFEFCWSE